ncbi:MAG: ParB N-terminal domain-containing protein [Deltaproteobacteria bacterium]|nr:ParB N-terminal domain-containing protein [Deltaproteobacteria bacterium]
MERSDFDLERLKSAEKLTVDEDFVPCPVKKGDELYPNGIFVFSITKMIEYIRDNNDKIELVEVTVADFPRAFSTIDESHVDSVDVSQPVLLAEISPGRYNLIDGNHRMDKARKMGISHILAYKLNVKQHMAFLTEKKAYISYIEYWNEKLE